MTISVSTMLFRYEDRRDEDGFTKIDLRRYFVTKSTLCGCWITIAEYNSKWKRWMRDGSKKKYAHTTKKAALESFIQRKRRQLVILEDQQLSAQESLNKALAMLEKGEV
jgi:hypothetical protein